MPSTAEWLKHIIKDPDAPPPILSSTEDSGARFYEVETSRAISAFGGFAGANFASRDGVKKYRLYPGKI